MFLRKLTMYRAGGAFSSSASHTHSKRCNDHSISLHTRPTSKWCPFDTSGPLACPRDFIRLTELQWFPGLVEPSMSEKLPKSGPELYFSVLVVPNVQKAWLSPRYDRKWYFGAILIIFSQIFRSHDWKTYGFHQNSLWSRLGIFEGDPPLNEVEMF